MLNNNNNNNNSTSISRERASVFALSLPHMGICVLGACRVGFQVPKQVMHRVILDVQRKAAVERARLFQLDELFVCSGIVASSELLLVVS